MGRTPSTPFPPLEPFCALAQRSPADPLIGSGADVPIKPLTAAGKTLDLTFLGSGRRTVFTTISQPLTWMQGGANTGIKLDKAKFNDRVFVRNAADQLLAVLVKEGTNFYTTVLICSPKPFAPGQAPSRYQEENVPLYCWYKVHGHYPLTDLFIEVYRNGTYQTEYTSQQHFTGTFCFGFVKNLGALSLFNQHRQPVARLRKNREAKATAAWDINAAPGEDPMLMVIFAVCADLSSRKGN